MTVGARIGSLVGSRLGSRVGSSPLPSGYTITWDVDGPGDGSGVPSDATQWADVAAAAGLASGPQHGWLMQDAAAPADVIGSADLTAFSTPAYQQAFATDWTGFCVHFNSTADALYNTSVVNTATTSALLLAYVALTGDPGTVQLALHLGSGGSQADRRIAAITAAGLWSARGWPGQPQATQDGVADPGTDVMLVAVQVDRAAGVFRVVTDQEVIAPVYTAPSSGSSAYVSFGDGASVMKVRAGWLFTGSAAELSVSQLRSLYTVLGRTPLF